MYKIRSLTAQDIPRLIEIQPGFVAETVLRVEKQGTPPFQTWVLREEPLPVPFDKKNGYDFNADEQDLIRGRLKARNSLQEVIELDNRIVGILDVEEEEWRNTAWIWNIMLDKSVRGQGLGRHLMERTIKWATSRKLRAILLETQTNNTPACHFYAHLGFKLIGINEIFYTNRDIEKDEVALFWGYTL